MWELHSVVLLYLASWTIKQCRNYTPGLLEAPTDVHYTASKDSVIMSWSPPFTLEGVPILHYSVYITSQGVSEQKNTTETHIALERPSVSTTYQISAWNAVGEGNATRKGNTVYFYCNGSLKPSLMMWGIAILTLSLAKAY